MKLIVFLGALLVSFSSQADWAEDFAELKDIPRDYSDAGSICEEVGRLQLFDEYPAPQHEIIVGIEYGDGARTIGELDLVVVDNNTQKVVAVGEVKCWKSFGGGLKKAQEQRRRFQDALRKNKAVQFRAHSGNMEFEAEDFEHVRDFFSMGPKGAEAAGYDRELEYSLKEMHKYREVMLQCQRNGECVGRY